MNWRRWPSSFPFIRNRTLFVFCGAGSHGNCSLVLLHRNSSGLLCCAVASGLHLLFMVSCTHCADTFLMLNISSRIRLLSWLHPAPSIDFCRITFRGKPFSGHLSMTHSLINFWQLPSMKQNHRIEQASTFWFHYVTFFPKTIILITRCLSVALSIFQKFHPHHMLSKPNKQFDFYDNSTKATAVRLSTFRTTLVHTKPHIDVRHIARWKRVVVLRQSIGWNLLALHILAVEMNSSSPTDRHAKCLSALAIPAEFRDMPALCCAMCAMGLLPFGRCVTYLDFHKREVNQKNKWKLTGPSPRRAPRYNNPLAFTAAFVWKRPRLKSRLPPEWTAFTHLLQPCTKRRTDSWHVKH